MLARFPSALARRRGPLLVIAALALTGAGAWLLGNLGDPQGVTQREIDEAVARTLASATPAPSVASQAFAVVAPSVVRLDVAFPEGGPGNDRGVGSGVVIDERGVILTSNHVIENAIRVTVIFADGSESDALVLAREPAQDIAILRAYVVPDDLMAATLVSSGTMRLGDEVVAVGSPFGLTHSISAGVVSGLRRSFKAPSLDRTLVDVIQFDAAVNPGNSGGPLVNRNGEVVGIVTGLLNPDGEVFIGIGFAVPIETAAGAAGPPWE